MSSVVVLTQNCAYWGERSLHDTILLMCRGKIEILRSDESRTIQAGVSRDGITFKMPAPLVVRLLDFVGFKYKNEEIKYSDEAVYSRDRNICQFWHTDEKGRRFKYRCTAEDRSIDHILPKSRGGINHFENCVCSCKNCNNKIKRNRLPEEAGLTLIRQPFIPRFRKGDMAIMDISFNPRSKAHEAYCDYVGVEFSHIVK
ncbi:MAG: HNH endonuclease [Dehalococcoidia bacterium]|nr:MAG: HNH endonuclease [Dehalococcoidia bacterium]